MNEQGPEETGRLTHTESMVALGQSPDGEHCGEALAAIGMRWRELRFNPWPEPRQIQSLPPAGDFDLEIELPTSRGTDGAAAAHAASAGAVKQTRTPSEERQPQEETHPSEKAFPLRFSSSSSSLGTAQVGSSSRGLGRAHPSTPAVNRFIRAHGRNTGDISDVERALWATRLAAEEGLRLLPHVPAVELAPETSSTVKHVWQYFLLLVACKWDRYPGSAVIFSRTFAAAWSEVSEDQARNAVDVLSSSRAMVCTPQKWRGLARMWLPRRPE